MEAHYNFTEEPEVVDREKLAQDLRVLMHDAGELLKSGVAEAGTKATELRSRLQASLQQMKETCRNLEQKTLASAKAADRTIRAHPYESIGVAFGLGLLIGVLSGRR